MACPDRTLVEAKRSGIGASVNCLSLIYMLLL